MQGCARILANGGCMLRYISLCGAVLLCMALCALHTIPGGMIEIKLETFKKSTIQLTIARVYTHHIQSNRTDFRPPKLTGNLIEQVREFILM